MWCVGLECPGSQPHFVCDLCLSGYVKAQCSQELRLVGKRQAKVFCPLVGHGCTSELTGTAGGHTAPYADPELAQHLDPVLFQAYLHAKISLMEQDLGQRMEEEKKQQIQAELGRLRALDERERRLHLACRHVREEVLTLKCPRCHQAFLDFNGCFALSCSRCDCGFCAWCLADCGEDAHAHIRDQKCRHSNGEVFGDLAKLKRVQRNQRIKTLVFL
jgi:hypothetical protein